MMGGFIRFSFINTRRNWAKALCPGGTPTQVGIRVVNRGSLQSLPRHGGPSSPQDSFSNGCVFRDRCPSRVCHGGRCRGFPGGDGAALERRHTPRACLPLQGRLKQERAVLPPSPSQCGYRATPNDPLTSWAPPPAHFTAPEPRFPFLHRAPRTGQARGGGGWALPLA